MNHINYFEEETDEIVKRYHISNDDLARINRLITEVIKSNPKLSRFINSIAVTSKDNYKRTRYEKKVCYDPYEINVEHFNEDRGTDIFQSIAESSILFANYGLSAIAEQLREHNVKVLGKIREFYRPIMAHLESSNFINIDDKVNNINRNMISTNGIRNLVNLSNRRRDEDHGTISKFLFVSEYNIFIAYITIDCKMFVRWPVIKNLMDNYSDRRIKSILKSLFTHIHEMSCIYDDLEFGKLQDTISQECVNDIIKGLGHSEVERMLDFNSNHLNRRIRDIADRKVKEAFESTVYTKDTGMYRRLVNGIFTRFQKQSNKLVADAFDQGMKQNSRMHLLGWVIAETSLNGSDLENVGIYWEKDVEVIPHTFCWENEFYDIPDDKKEWKITKLLIAPNGSMRCKGKHPNVSSGNVCMGDLGNIDFNQNFDDLKDDLIRAEKLLEIINYDSAYDSSKRESLYRAASKRKRVLGRDKNAASMVKAVGMSNIRSLKIRNKIIQASNDNNKNLVEVEVNPTENGNSEQSSRSIQATINTDMIRVSELVDTINKFRDRFIDMFDHEPHECSHSLVYGLPNGESLIGLCRTSRSSDNVKAFYYRDRYAVPKSLGVSDFLELVQYCKLIKGDATDRKWVNWLPEEISNGES